MSMALIRCKAIPADAELKNFDVIGQAAGFWVFDTPDEKQHYQFISDIRFFLKKYQCEILVKSGFVTDGGSVPRLFWTAISDPYSTRMLMAFILHDAIYAAQIFDRETCDMILLEFLEELGVDWLRRNQIYLAVRAGGGVIWSRHSGETLIANQKIVKKIPMKNEGK